MANRMTPEELEEWDRLLRQRLAEYKEAKGSDPQPSIDHAAEQLYLKRQGRTPPTKLFRCRSIGLICDFEVNDITVEKVLEKIRPHLLDLHNLNASPDLITDTVRLWPSWLFVFISIIATYFLLSPLSLYDPAKLRLSENLVSIVSLAMIGCYFVSYYLADGDRAALWFNRIQGTLLGFCAMFFLYRITAPGELGITALAVIYTGVLLPLACFHRIVAFEESFAIKVHRLAQMLAFTTWVMAGGNTLVYLGQLLKGSPNFYGVDNIQKAAFLFRAFFLAYLSLLGWHAWEHKSLSSKSIEKVVFLGIFDLALIVWLWATTDFWHFPPERFWLGFESHVILSAFLIQDAVLQENKKSHFAYRAIFVASSTALCCFTVLVLLSASGTQSHGSPAPLYYVISACGALASIGGALMKIVRPRPALTGPRH
jgi:predicted small metal-binding protein